MSDTPTLPVPADRPGQLATARPARRHPRRRNLAGEAKEPAHAPRLPARRAPLHARRSASPTSTQLRQVDHRAVIAWERMQREQEGAAASTIRRRLAALVQLVQASGETRGGEPQSRWWTLTGRRSIATKAAPRPSRRAQARKLLDAPPTDTLAGLARPRHSLGRPAGRFPPRGNRRLECRRPAPEPGLRCAARDAQGRPARCPGHQPADRAAHPRLS